MILKVSEIKDRLTWMLGKSSTTEPSEVAGCRPTWMKNFEPNRKASRQKSVWLPHFSL